MGDDCSGRGVMVPSSGKGLLPKSRVGSGSDPLPEWGSQERGGTAGC